MFENVMNFFKKLGKKDGQTDGKKNKDEAKERLHLVLMQDRANVSADFLDMMRQEIINVIKKYIDVDENEIDVTLTNKSNGDGTTGIPALYANIPIKSIKNDIKQTTSKDEEDNSTEKKKANKELNNDSTNSNKKEENDSTVKGKTKKDDEIIEKVEVKDEEKSKEKKSVKKK